MALTTGVDTWNVTYQETPVTTPTARQHLLQFIRTHLERFRASRPGATTCTIETPFGSIRATRTEPQVSPTAPLELSVTHPKPLSGSASTKSEVCVVKPLPDNQIAEQTATLVGLEGLLADLLGYLSLAIGREPPRSVTPPRAFTDHLRRQGAFFLLYGPPGTGKTATAYALADIYCRTHGMEGGILWLGSNRGTGLVGSVSQTLLKAADHLLMLPEDGLRMLIVDEIDAWAPRRGQANQHHEDAAGVTALAQVLDRLSSEPNVAVVATTNTLSIDEAIKRRCCRIVSVPRPSDTARRVLLARWLPSFSEPDLERLVRASRGLSASDLLRELTTVWVSALSSNTDPLPKQVQKVLSSAQRTGDVEKGL